MPAIPRRFRDPRAGAAGLLDPCDASAAVPLVLLPVRLETRFDFDGGGRRLRVRIYPDEIHVDDLARGLSEAEAEAGAAYWAEVWPEPPADGAWERLLAAVGPDRAEWVAHARRPLNPGERGTAAEPSFAAAAPPGPRGVLARALPDRFVVVAVQGGHVSRQRGEPIPSDLPLSPIPLADEEPKAGAAGLAVPPGSEWLVDFEQAKAVGMAVTIALTGADAPVERVVALGTRASLTAAGGADELEDLLLGHRFGSGLGLLAQGTPTNNADAARSPYRARREPVPPALAGAGEDPRSDAAATARALGVDPAFLTGLLGPGHGEQEAARLANTALWAPGWGEYLSRLDAQDVPGLDDAQRESARQLFADHVRGRGPAAAIHVGRQPYGVLPVSDLRAWEPAGGETTEGVAAVVAKLLDRWLVAARTKVPRVRAGDRAVDRTTLEILGSSPVMQGLRVRPVITDEVTDTVLASLGLSRATYEAERDLAAAVLSPLLGRHAGKAVVGSLHDETRPLPLPLASERDREFVVALLEDPSRVLDVDSVAQALFALAWQSHDLDVARAAPAKVLPALIELAALEPGLKASAAALAARAESAPAAELHGVVAELQDAGVSIAGTSQLLAFQPAEQIPISLAEVALAAPPTRQAKALAAATLGWWLAAMGYRSEVRTALEGLAETDLETRRLAVAEALDCSSHRLDAWATAVVSARRARQLERGGAAAARGLTIGAYGVVENLWPARGDDPEGWIHAPSSGHAVAAGMLRSAHLSHLPAGEGGGGGPFAIDLSSARMRAAAHLIEGVRQGQQLGALVGYQIERGLAEAGLARLQLSLRAIAPLVARRLSDADGGDSQRTQEAVAAANVVDGVLLLERHPPGDALLRAKLAEEPQNAYLEPGTWVPLDGAEWKAVTATMRAAAESVDAVADALLSESVLQYASGNSQRAAAALDAMASGAGPSDTLDVLEARDEGDRLNHRLLAVVGPGAPPSGWSQSRPRAVVEPRLEAWAAALLGDPDEIVVATLPSGRRPTLAEADLAALDLVHAEPAQLERSLRTAIPELGETALALAPEQGWPQGTRALGQVLGLAATLRALIAGGRPLLPDDLTRPGERPTRDLGAALPELIGRAGKLTDSLEAAAAGFADAVAAIPEDGILADPAAAAALAREAHAALEPFSVALEPDPKLPLDVSWVRSAWEVANARALAARAQLDRLAGPPGEIAPSLALDAVEEAVEAVFGGSFLVLPLLAPGPAAAVDSFAEAVESPAFPAPAASDLRRFVRDLGTVRPQATRLSEALLLAAALGRPRPLRAVQLSERDESRAPAPGTGAWLAGPLPPQGPWPQGPAAHLVLDRLGEVGAGTELAGLAIDAWVEDLPAQPGPKADPDDPRPNRARTGLAIRSNSASARPPQSLLCAISPDGERWTTDSLLATVEHTVDLARIRMVTLERLAGEGLALPALYTRSSSLQGEEHLHFGRLARNIATSLQVPFVKDGGS